MLLVFLQDIIKNCLIIKKRERTEKSIQNSLELYFKVREQRLDIDQDYVEVQIPNQMTNEGNSLIRLFMVIFCVLRIGIHLCDYEFLP